MNKRKLITIVSCLAGFFGLLFLCFIVLNVLGIGILGKIGNDILSKKAEQTTQETTQQVPQTTELTEIKQPDNLSYILSESGYTYEDLTNTKQLITVHKNNGEYIIECFEYSNGQWANTDIIEKAHVGKNGTISADEKRESDYYTPRGLYRIGFAFGKKENPGTIMEYRTIDDNIYWVDDSDSPLYNQWVNSEGREITWNSAEKMCTYEEYNYGAVIEYNTDPIVKGKGSAIFLHVGSKFTAGCVASDEETIVAILKWLNPDYNPKILIT